MVARFNPPPGWAFPAGWQPDPAWPTPPPGWSWWVDDWALMPQPIPPALVPHPPANPWAPPEQPWVGPRGAGPGRRARALAWLGAACFLIAGGGGIAWAVTNNVTQTQTHDLIGSVQIMDVEAATGGCLAGDTAWRMERLNYATLGEVFECGDGIGGRYADVVDGATVTVTDQHGAPLGVGTLSEGALVACHISF